MGDLGSRWKDLSQQEQQNTAIVLAQSRQYPKLIALLSNYSRYQEALTKSQGASGDAFRANQIELATFAKQIAISENQIKSFAATAMQESTGVVSAITSMKVALGSFVNWTGETGAGVAGFLSTIGLVGGAYLGLSKLLPKTTLELIKEGESLDIADENWKRHISVVQQGGKNYKQVVPMIGKYVMGIAAFIGVLALASVIWERATREQRRHNLIIAEGTEEFKKFQQSLSEMDFTSISKENVEQKLKAIITTTKKLGDVNSDSAVSVKNMVDAYSKLFLGKPGGNLAQEELIKLRDNLDSVQEKLKQSVMKPYFDAIETSITSIAPKFIDFTKALETGGGSARQSLLDLANQFGIIDKYTTKLIAKKGIRGGLNPVENKFGFQQVRAAAVSEVSKAADVLSESLNSAVQSLITYQMQLDAVSDSSGKALPGFEAVAKSIEENITNTAENAAKQIVNFIGVENLFGQAIKDVNKIAESGLLYDTQIGRAKAALKIQEAIPKVIREIGQAYGVQEADIIKSIEAMNKNKDVLNSLIKTLSSAGVFAIEFNDTAFTTGLKQTTSSLFAGFQEQINLLYTVDKISQKIGASFNLAAELSKFAETSLGSLSQKLFETQRMISDAEIELAGLQQTQKVLQQQGIVESDPNIAGKRQQDIDRLVTKTTLLREAEKLNKELIEKQSQALQTLKLAAIEVLEAEKQRSQVLEAEGKLSADLLIKLIDFNKIKFSSKPSAALQENEKLYERIYQIQLAVIRGQAAYNGTEEAVLRTKEQQLRLEYESDAVMRKAENISERLGKNYGKIQDGVDSVRTSFSKLLSDEDNFFDIMESRGSLFEFLRQGAKGVSDAIAQMDSEVIAKKASEIFKPAFDLNSQESKNLENALITATQSSQFSQAIQDPITVSGTLVANLIKASIIDGSSMVQIAIEKLPTAIINALQKLQEEASKTTGEVTQLMKDAGITFDQTASKTSDAASIMNQAGDKMVQAANAYAGAVDKSMGVTLPTVPGVPNSPIEYAFASPEQLELAQALADAATNVANSSDSATQAITKMTSPLNNTTFKINPEELNTDSFEKRMEAGRRFYEDLNKNKLDESIPVLEKINTSTEETARSAEEQKALLRRGVSMFGNMVGAGIAKARGVDTSGAQMGSEIGTMAGALIGSTGGPTGAYAGSMIGSLIGSLFGGLVGGDKLSDAEQAQLDQLKSIEQNTAQLVDRLTPEILNAPTGFVLPMGTGFGGGINITNHFVISGSGNKKVIDELATQLNDLYNRSSHSLSIME
jgi:hypothetical protein